MVVAMRVVGRLVPWVLVAACGAPPAEHHAAPPPVASAIREVPLDACQQAIADAVRGASLPIEVVLLSVAGADAEAARWDAWLQTLASRGPTPIAYRWVALDDSSYRLARRAGVVDAHVAVVLEHGVALASLRLDGEPDAGALAWLVRALRGWMKVMGEDVRTCHLPASAVSSRRPGRFELPTRPLVGSDALARATTLRIEEPSRSVTLERDGATWKVKTAAGAFEADAENVRRSLADLGEIELHETLAKDSKDDARFGLDPTAATHVVVAAGAETLVDFRFGRAGARGAAVRVGAAPEVVVASGLSEWMFQRELRFWRNRAIWSFDREAVQRIEIDGARRWVFTRAKGAWRATLDGRPFAPLAEDAVMLLVSAFRELVAEDFAESNASTGLTKDARVIRFVVGGERKVLRVGAARAAGGSYAQVDGNPTVYVIGAYPASWIDRAPALFRKSP